MPNLIVAKFDSQFAAASVVDKLLSRGLLTLPPRNVSLAM